MRLQTKYKIDLSVEVSAHTRVYTCEVKHDNGKLCVKSRVCCKPNENLNHPYCNSGAKGHTFICWIMLHKVNFCQIGDRKKKNENHQRQYFFLEISLLQISG